MATVAVFGTAALLLLALGGCEFFTATAYPDYVSSIAAETSVSRWYDGDRSEAYLDASADLRGNRLFFSVPDGPEGPRMLVFDETLEVVENWSVSELNTLVGGGSGSLGTRAGFGASFQPVVGHFVFDPATESLTPTRETSGIAGAISDEFGDITGRPDPATPRVYAFVVDNSADPTELRVDAYDGLFGGLGAESNAVDVDGTGDEYRLLEAVAINEGSIGDSFVLLLLGNVEREVVYVVVVPFLEFPLGSAPFGSVSSHLLEGTYPFFQIDGVDAGRGFVTADGLVLFDEDEDYLVLQSLENEEIARLELENAGDVDIAVPIDADFFYLFDRRRERLFTLSNFWD
jgi:hypothetical protein